MCVFLEESLLGQTIGLPLYLSKYPHISGRTTLHESLGIYRKSVRLGAQRSCLFGLRGFRKIQISFWA